jgi:lipoprotein LprG
MDTARARQLAVRCLTAAFILLVSSCTGGGGAEDAASLSQRLATAKRSLDQAASIDLSLRTDRMPPGVDGISAAEGVATHAPAFRGRITIAAAGLFDGQTVEVVAVGGQVYAETPFSSSFIRVDPADFNAPDPARLMDPGAGLSTLLTEATDLSEGEQQREGEVVLSSVTGRVPGAVVARTFPSASAGEEFDATFWLDDQDTLRRAELTGPFYGDGPPVTYELEVEPSDEPVEITAP